MKLLCVGDLHYRASVPRGRKDNFLKSFFNKTEQIYDISDDYDCDHILAPGDVFDGSVPPLWLIETFINTSRGRGLLAILGQHDMRYHHTDRKNTPLGVAAAAKAVRILGKMPFVSGDVEFYGASWSSKIPVPGSSDSIKVLLMHRMVIKNKKLWAQQEDFVRSNTILHNHMYDLIVTGDNHQFFTDSYGGRHLVNCGSLMRTNIDQMNHRPSVVLYDTESRGIEVLALDVEPAEDVLDLEKSEQAKARNEDLDAFIEQVKSSKGAPDLDFLGNLDKLVKSKDVSLGVQAKVNEIVEMSE